MHLFVERAQAVQPDFRLTAANARSVAQICRRLDGIPLAIELAAARIRALPADQIAARLDDQFRLLTGGGRMTLPRHRTLLAAFDWSYDLLTATERELFARLSVFAGSFSLDAAEAVCAGGAIARGEILDLLTHLIDRSLVISADAAGEARYQMLHTLRQYAQEKCADTSEVKISISGTATSLPRSSRRSARPSSPAPSRPPWSNAFLGSTTTCASPSGGPTAVRMVRRRSSRWRPACGDSGRSGVTWRRAGSGSSEPFHARQAKSPRCAPMPSPAPACSPPSRRPRRRERRAE